jgi:hypothetical protein
MCFRKSTVRERAFYFLRECNPLSVFYFGVHFTVVDNKEKRVIEDRSFSAL